MTTIRRASLAVLAILVLEYGIGVYVNLYATVPSTDHGAGIATAIARGPAALSTHAVLGLLLGLGAVAVLVQAIRIRRPAVIVASALGLFAVAVAAATGASFTSTGETADSMGMAVMTGVALLCYAANLYLLPRPASTAQASTTRAYPAGGATTGAGKSRV
ncbi:MAG: hypothetical protein ACRDPF_02235 [Streptosporangiaceae bacterium]